MASVVGVTGGQAARDGSAGSTVVGSAYTDGRYIITFVDDAVASYDGYETGFRATRPQPGRKLNPDSPAVQRWQQHLIAKHNGALGRVGAGKIYDYTITNNGVAAYLTAKQAA